MVLPITWAVEMVDLVHGIQTCASTPFGRRSVPVPCRANGDMLAVDGLAQHERIWRAAEAGQALPGSSLGLRALDGADTGRDGSRSPLPGSPLRPSWPPRASNEASKRLPWAQGSKDPLSPGASLRCGEYADRAIGRPSLSGVSSGSRGRTLSKGKGKPRGVGPCSRVSQEEAAQVPGAKA